MNNLPLYIDIVFGLTILLTLGFFFKATRYSKAPLLILLGWIIFQTMIGLSGFYSKTDGFPPRFLLMILPPLLLIAGLFTSSKGKRFLKGIDIQTLTLLHIIRIPVELVLFWLYLQKVVPIIMTFEGRNFDIISGLSAPIIYYFGFRKMKMSRITLLIWNFVCIGLLINIVSTAILSAPFPFQKFAFDQPNIAVLYFPFNLLPSFIVPLVLFSHLATIRQLIFSGKGVVNNSLT